MTKQYYGHQGPAVGSGRRNTDDAEYLRNLQTIAVKMAAFCARLSGHEDVPETVATEGMKLCHEYKQVDNCRLKSVDTASP